MGAAYGTAKSGVGVASMGVMRPELVMKSIVPVVMAGVLGIYGLIIAVIISTGINPKAKSYYLFDGYAHLSSGLACGLAGLSAGMAIGIVGDAGVRYYDHLLCLPMYTVYVNACCLLDLVTLLSNYRFMFYSKHHSFILKIGMHGITSIEIDLSIFFMHANIIVAVLHWIWFDFAIVMTSYTLYCVIIFLFFIAIPFHLLAFAVTNYVPDCIVLCCLHGACCFSFSYFLA